MLSNRITKWLKINDGVHWSQSAIFNRDGVKNNTLLVNAAFQSKRTVIFFDLSDAFNGVCHNLLFHGLKASGSPDFLVNKINSIYKDCKTIPINLNKEQLGCPLIIGSGVKHGCPLSATLFNFFIDPILRATHAMGVTCMGYMDNLAAIILPDIDPQVVVDKISDIASKLCMKFNAKKCGATNAKDSITLNGAPVPTISDTNIYKYLGTNASKKKLRGLLEILDNFQRDLEMAMKSELTPMQKLHTIRTHLLPKLNYLIKNSSPLQSHL